MANAPAVIEHIPAYLTQYRQEGFNQRFAVPAGEPIGRISIEGKVFTFILQDDRELVQSAQGNAMPFLDVCIVDASEATSKAYWTEGFERGATDRPDCSSIHGDAPDPGSPHPQAKTCAACQWNKFNTALKSDGSVGKGKRCGDSKRIAVLPAFDFDNKDWGGPMLTRIPPTSFKDFGKYWKEQDALGRDLNLIITRMKFDPLSPHPKLFFNFQRWITEEEAQLMNEWAQSEHIKRVLMVTQAELAGDIDEEIEPEPEPTPQRQAQAEGSAAAKVAARRTAQAPTPQPQRRAAPAPQPAQQAKANGPTRRMPAQEAPEEQVAAPAKRATPVQQPAKGTGAPVRRPAAAANVVETPDQLRARKKRELDALIAQAEALDAELNEGDVGQGPLSTEETGVVYANGEYEDVTDDGHASTTDLLSAIDADELAGIPD